MPKTTTKGGGRPRRWPVYAVVVLSLVALALVVEAFLRAEGFAPGEEISTPAVRDVAVSAENSLYPPPDVGRFGWRPRAVYVYLSVEDLPAGEDEPLSATVERTASRPALRLLPGLEGLFGGDTGLVLADSGEDRIERGENGATGVVKFVLTDRSGGPLPAGNYTVSIADEVGGEPTVQKRFSVGG
jgi:hypothetical protein